MAAIFCVVSLLSYRFASSVCAASKIWPLPWPLSEEFIVLVLPTTTLMVVPYSTSTVLGDHHFIVRLECVLCDPYLRA